MDSSGDDEKATEEFLRLPSNLPEVGIDLYGFASEDEANAVGQAVQFWLHAFGKMLNLKRLLRVVVSFNYREALADLDRGTPTARPLISTNDEIAIGIAMTPAVMHEGEVRSVIVLNAAYVALITRIDSPEHDVLREEVTYTLAHECAHVHDLEMQAASIPELTFNTVLPFCEQIIFGIVVGCWNEYIACRLSAFMGKEFTLRAYEDTFCLALERAKGRGDAIIRQYRMHGDVSRVTLEVSEEYRKVLVFAAYLMGHLDGLDLAFDESAPKARKAVESSSYFGAFFSRLWDDLRELHSTYGSWNGKTVFDPLRRLVHEFLKIGGIDIQTRPDGTCHVNVPFRPETVPTLQEQADFAAARDVARKEE